MKYLLISACVLGLVPAAQAGEVNITFSEKFAETLQDKLGEREGTYLIKQLTRDIEQEFGDELATMGDINIKIIDAKANRPTMKEMGDKPGLSMRSIAVGGASLEGEVLGEDGEVIASTNYKYYETDIRYAKGSATWSDAKRSFNRFADKLGKEYRKATDDADADS